MNETHINPDKERDDDVGTLVRLAGRRKAVPAETAARVKAATREEWRSQLSKRSGLRVWAGVGGAAVAASLLLLVGLRFVSPGGDADTGMPGPNLVVAVSGVAWVAPSGAASDRVILSRRDVLEPGSELSTDARGRAAIRMATGHLLRLDTSTVLRLRQDGSIQLGHGAVYIDSGFDSVAAGPLDVHTQFGIVREIGTQFEVRLDESSVHVKLREGVVKVNQGEDEHEMQAGTELVLASDGSVNRRPLSTYDPGWDWIATVTPVPDFEGRTVRSFLEWAARERGWRLSFLDEETAASATGSVLSGTSSRMTLEEALDAALATSRMTWQVEEGVLEVSSPR